MDDSGPKDEFTIQGEDASGRAAQGLVEVLCAELSQLYGTPPSPFSPADVSTPGTVFLVARRADEPVACGALRRMDDATAEIKRMYVAPTVRRQGLARRILDALERHAIDFGYRAVRLETGIHQHAAIALYESCGYRHIDSFGSYIGDPFSVCFEKVLLSQPSTVHWIETERTRLRPFEEADAEEAFAWFSDPVVMRFIPRGRDLIVDDTRARIIGYREHQARFGFSKRLVIHRATGKPIGDSGLFHLPDGKRIELGFRFAQPYWGAGYAMEVGQAWLRWIDEHFPEESLFADVHSENVRSQRVLSKLGFRHSHEELIFDMPMLIFQRAPPGSPASP